jgi:hypothetical protein
VILQDAVDCPVVIQPKDNKIMSVPRDDLWNTRVILCHHKACKAKLAARRQVLVDFFHLFRGQVNEVIQHDELFLLLVLIVERL